MGKKFAKKSAKKTSTSVKVNNKQQNKLKRGGVKKNNGQVGKKTVRKAKKTKNTDKKDGKMEEVALYSTQGLRKMMVNDKQIDLE